MKGQCFSRSKRSRSVIGWARAVSLAFRMAMLCCQTLGGRVDIVYHSDERVVTVRTMRVVVMNVLCASRGSVDGAAGGADHHGHQHRNLRHQHLGCHDAGRRPQHISQVPTFISFPCSSDVRDPGAPLTPLTSPRASCVWCCAPAGRLQVPRCMTSSTGCLCWCCSPWRLPRVTCTPSPS